MRVMTLAFEVQDGIDDVLERLGASQAAVLRDVADQERRNVVALCRKQELRRRLANLADAAGRRLKLQREHGLDRIHDHQRRLHAADFFENALDAGFGQQVERRIADAEAIAARLDLMFGFLARRVEDGTDRLREVGGCLQQQGGLADAGFPAEQNQRSGDDAAAEHAIEFADARRDAIGFRGFNVRVLLRARRLRARASRNDASSVRRARPSKGRSSTNELHAPQSSHLPCHLGRWTPHSWQTKTGLACFIACHIHGHRDTETRRDFFKTIQATSEQISSSHRLTKLLRDLRASVAMVVSVVFSFHAWTQAAQDLVWNRADPVGHFARVDAALSPCDPRNTTSSPGPTPSMSVTSTVSMSMLTAPTIFARWPRISTNP